MTTEELEVTGKEHKSLHRDESQNVEYKESWHDKCLAWICGYANAQGGTIYVAWHPPINLIVQRFVDSMQARMVLGQYPSCPFNFPTEEDKDEEYLVWEINAIDTKPLEARLKRTAAKNLFTKGIGLEVPSQI